MYILPNYYITYLSVLYIPVGPLSVVEVLSEKRFLTFTVLFPFNIPYGEMIQAEICVCAYTWHVGICVGHDN